MLDFFWIIIIETTAIPQPQAGEILIKTAYAGVNRPDILQRQGLYPVPEGVTPILGLEISGEVVALGKGVDLDEVFNCWMISGEYDYIVEIHVANNNDLKRLMNYFYENIGRTYTMLVIKNIFQTSLDSKD